MCKISGGKIFGDLVKVKCPICGAVTEKYIAVCNCNKKWWGSHMFVKSLCKRCATEYHNGTLESKVEFMPKKSENPKEPRIVIGLKESASSNLDINN